MSEAKPTPGPCPFCGHVGLDFAEGSTFRWIVASCEGCGASLAETRIQTLGEGTKDEWMAEAKADAIAAWNRRSDPLVERVKELEEALNCITSMCETHGDFRNGVTDPTGTIDEGNVIAGRIVGDARAVLTKYRTNAADVKEHPGASVGTALPAGWVPLTITHEGQYPEEVAYGPKIMMDRLGKWLGKYFAQIAAPAQMPDLQPLHNLLYLAQRQTSLVAMQRVVSEARLDLAKVRDAALSKARPNTAEGE